MQNQKNHFIDQMHASCTVTVKTLNTHTEGDKRTQDRAGKTQSRNEWVHWVQCEKKNASNEKKARVREAKIQSKPAFCSTTIKTIYIDYRQWERVSLAATSRSASEFSVGKCGHRWVCVCIRRHWARSWLCGYCIYVHFFARHLLSAVGFIFAFDF